MQAELRGISKSYNGTNVVESLSLDVYEGEILAIIGPSGCGKTTLLQMIAGLENNEQGSIRIAGELVSSTKDNVFITADQRQIALVFQDYALWPHYNVFQNVAYPLQIKGVGKHQIRDEVDELLSLVSLKGMEKRYPHELSGGEQQRVALARALGMHPRLLLLDESLSNLDAKLKEKMQYEIKKIQRKLGLTIIHVTHDQNEAMAIADRMAVMNKGKLIQVDTPKEIYDNPKTEFVASFIGSTNLIYSKRDDNGQRSWDFGLDIVVGDTCMISMPEEAVIISVRPEDIILHRDKGMARGEIVEIVYKGNVINYGLDVGGRILNVQTSSQEHFELGDELWFTIRNATVVEIDD